MITRYTFTMVWLVGLYARYVRWFINTLIPHQTKKMQNRSASKPGKSALQIFYVVLKYDF